MKKEIPITFSRPCWARKDSATGALIRKTITFCGILLLCFFLLLLDNAVNRSSVGTGPELADFFQLLVSLETLAVQAMFLPALIMVILVLLLLWRSKSAVFWTYEPKKGAQVRETTLNISRMGLHFHFQEPFTLAKTPWSKVSCDADYSLKYSWEDVARIRLSRVKGAKSHVLLFIHGEFEGVMKLNGTLTCLSAAEKRKLLLSRANRLYAWVPDQYEQELVNAIESAIAGKGVDFK